MGDQNRIMIIINADGTAAIEGMNRVTGGMKKMETETVSIAGKIQAAWVNVAAGLMVLHEALYMVERGYHLLIGKTVEAGTEFAKTSQQIGLSVENLSALKYAAELSETSYEALTTGVGFFSRSLYGMNEEGKDTTATLKAMGVDSKDTHSALLQVAEEFAHMEDGATKTAIAMELFGRGGRQMIPFLNEGKKGILELEEAAHRAGVTFTTEGAKSAKQLGDSIKELTANFEGLQFVIGGPLIDKMNYLFRMFNDFSGAHKLANQIDAIDERIRNKMIVIERGTGDTFWRHFYSNDVINAANDELLKLQTQRDKLVKEYNQKYVPPEIARTTPGADVNPPPPAVVGKQPTEMYGPSEEDFLAWQGLEQKKRDLAVETMLLNEEKDVANIKEKQRLYEIERQDRIQKETEFHEANLRFIQEEADFKVQAYEESWQAMFNIANQVGGEMGQGMGVMLAGIKGMTDIGQGKDPYTAEYNSAVEHYTRLMQAKIAYAGELANIDYESSQISIAYEEMATKQKITMWADAAQAASGVMSMIAAGMDVRNEEDFKKQQLMQFNIAGVNTAVGITRAFATYDWPYNFVVAAIVGAAGLIQQANIMSRKYNSASGPIGFSGGGGGGYSYNKPTEPKWEKTEEKPRPQITHQYIITTNVDVKGHIVDNDGFAREIIPSINKAISDGVKLNVNGG